MRKYYYHAQGESHGPFDLEELQDELPTDDTLVWCEGMPHWMPANRMPELNPESLPPLPHEERGSNSFRDFVIAVLLMGLLFAVLSAGSIKRYLFGDNRAQTEQVETPEQVAAIPDENEQIDAALPANDYVETKRNPAPARNIDPAPVQNESTEELIVETPSGHEEITPDFNINSIDPKLAEEVLSKLKVTCGGNYREIGGISDMVVHVENNLDYLVNRLTIRISYIK